MRLTSFSRDSLEERKLNSENLQHEESEGCKCPQGFKGDGVKSCEGTLSLFRNLILQDLEHKIWSEPKLTLAKFG